MVTAEKAKEIIEKNYSCSEGSFVAALNDKDLFSPELFWEYYNSITILVAEDIFSEEITAQIGISYQSILKLFIYHFSEQDSCHFENFPEDYNGYIERLDYAVESYYTRRQMALSEDKFELQREIKTCEECGSKYYAMSSKMQSMCPECASILYGYDNCNHVFKGGRCIKCFWDGSRSNYIDSLIKGK